MTTATRGYEKINKFIISKTPLGRWGKAEELDGVVVFLASDASFYVTGEVINVDGGWMAT